MDVSIEKNLVSEENLKCACTISILQHKTLLPCTLFYSNYFLVNKVDTRIHVCTSAEEIRPVFDDI